MASGMHIDERSIDCLVLGHHDEDRKVSAKSVTMRAMTLCKNVSGYRELLLKCCLATIMRYVIVLSFFLQHLTLVTRGLWIFYTKCDVILRFRWIGFNMPKRFMCISR